MKIDKPRGEYTGFDSSSLLSYLSFISCISGLPRGEPCEGCVSQARTRRRVTVLALVPDK
jgi:hypothetical protein